MLDAEEEDPAEGAGLVHGVHGTGGGVLRGIGDDGMCGTGHARAPFGSLGAGLTIRPWTAAKSIWPNRFGGQYGGAARGLVKGVNAVGPPHRGPLRRAGRSGPDRSGRVQTVLRATPP
ncbi:hypothetical protein GCM10017687_62720 [Streptomyces echinatus]